ncbi:hypothetical protein [Pseudonocardia sp. McavD-2-B]|uniref:hypothetical protein n=1 Tax=Pseudonocardia sp. McavD-2-B TaxID=2954499 RepID=UPI0020979EDD|nr:hypothetical protein [Pseudonocardia sp. McavD-2-B]MCO7195046.1 hypothetical protein [Pseudonocardia sp. McavD-2-B]
MIRFARFAVPLVAALALAGCGGEPAPAPESATLSDAEAAFVDQAASIVPGHPDDAEGLASDAANTCSSLTNTDAETGEPWPRERIVDQAVERFSTGSYPVDADQAGQLVDAAAGTVCQDG